MLIQHFAERKLNAALYFKQHTRDCTPSKLSQLLYLLDFEQFRQTGRSVTNDLYIATAEGPVSRSQGGIDVEAKPQDAADPHPSFCSDHFTPRNMRILADLCERYGDSSAEDISTVTCAPDGPWNKTYLASAGEGAVIDYALILDGHPSREMILESAREHEMFVAAFSQSTASPA
jgi:uncharacterized phage-associated protein